MSINKGKALLMVVTAVLGAVSSARGNLLLNDGFETNSGAGGSADWWSNWAASGTENWANHSGDWGMAINSWGTNWAGFSQDYDSGQAGYQYTFSIWACKDIGDWGFEASNAYLKLEFRDSGGNSVGSWVTNDIYSSLDSSWQQFSVSGISPSNTAKVRVVVDIPWINNDGAGAAKFDDAQLTEEIPEPVTLSWILAGFLELFALRGLRQHTVRRQNDFGQSH